MMTVGRIEFGHGVAHEFETAFSGLSQDAKYRLRTESLNRLSGSNWRDRVYSLSRETALLQNPPTTEALRALASKLDDLSRFLFTEAEKLDA